jgi:hypothetical protein
LPVTAANFVVEVEFKVCFLLEPALVSDLVSISSSNLDTDATVVQISGDQSHLFGDGFVLWLTKTRAQPGPVFGSVGTSSLLFLRYISTSLLTPTFVDNFEGLAIIVDTYDTFALYRDNTERTNVHPATLTHGTLTPSRA